MPKGRHGLLLAGASALTAVAVFLTAYHFGHHNIWFSRSYYLEKEIRRLLYLETHEPIDYRLAIKTYEDLLARTRFDQGQGDHVGRYEKALKRTRKKKQIIDLLEEHQSTGRIKPLNEARENFQNPEYPELEEYYFTSIWYEGHLLSEDWFQAATKKANGTEISQDPQDPQPVKKLYSIPSPRPSGINPSIVAPFIFALVFCAVAVTYFWPRRRISEK